MAWKVSRIKAGMTAAGSQARVFNYDVCQASLICLSASEASTAWEPTMSMLLSENCKLGRVASP